MLVATSTITGSNLMNPTNTNSIVQTQFPVLDDTLALRHQLLDLITDEDLAFTLPGNPPLGVLCRQLGEFDHSYVQAMKTLKQEWTYQHADAAVETSVDALREWYATLESEFKAAVATMTEAQVQSGMVDRGHGMVMPIMIVFHLYRESLLIFYGKVSVYLRAMGKDLPQQWQTWIA